MSALRELTLMRIRMFTREPEALFWTFVFPVLMAGGLGVAFRAGGPERVPVAVEAGAAGRHLAALAGDAELDAREPEEIDAEIARRWPQIGRAVAEQAGERFEQAIVAQAR